MATMASATNRTDQAHAFLRTDILRGHWRPGERLKLAPLCGRYGASVGVMREALSRLTGEGLVLSEPNIGYRVIPISPADLEDLTQVRVDLEGLALRRAVERGDLQWEARLAGAYHSLQRTPRLRAGAPELSDDWVKVHTRFHDELLSGCGSPRLHALARSQREAAELYRHWSVPLEGATPRDIDAEHRAIYEAAMQRNAEAAVAALTDHITHTTRLVLKSPTDGAT